MTVRVRPYKKGKKKAWEVDITYEWPGKKPVRKRRKSQVEGKENSKRWGIALEAELIKQELEGPRLEAPTLVESASTFLGEHAEANEHSPDGIAARRSLLKCHVFPLEVGPQEGKKTLLGDKRLDAITSNDIEALKLEMKKKALSIATRNMTLRLLSSILTVAVERGAIRELPLQIKELKAEEKEPSFYSFEQLDAVRQAALSLGIRVLVVVLLAADAGLRKGEIAGLEWPDIDFARRDLVVRRSVGKTGEARPTKGKAHRRLPMTDRLASALQQLRQRGAREVPFRRSAQTRLGCQLRLVIANPPPPPVEGRVISRARQNVPAGPQSIRRAAVAAQRRAGLGGHGEVHILRHTFCTHLAMKGVPVTVIQKLAGHKSLRTTMRYLHVVQGVERDAINALQAVRTDDGGTQHLA